jgi:hypothetical protein
VPVSIRARAAVVFSVLRPVAPASPERDPCIASVLPDCVRLEAFELGPDAVPAKLAQDSGADAGAGAEADAEEQLGRAPAIFGRDFDAGALAGEAKDGVTRVFPCVLLDFFNGPWPSAWVAGGSRRGQPVTSERHLPLSSFCFRAASITGGFWEIIPTGCAGLAVEKSRCTRHVHNPASPLTLRSSVRAMDTLMPQGLHDDVKSPQKKRVVFGGVPSSVCVNITRSRSRATQAEADQAGGR